MTLQLPPCFAILAHIRRPSSPTPSFSVYALMQLLGHESMVTGQEAANETCWNRVEFADKLQYFASAPDPTRNTPVARGHFRHDDETA
jgi:hypothetical protein